MQRNWALSRTPRWRWWCGSCGREKEGHNESRGPEKSLCCWRERQEAGSLARRHLRGHLVPRGSGSRGPGGGSSCGAGRGQTSVTQRTPQSRTGGGREWAPTPSRRCFEVIQREDIFTQRGKFCFFFFLSKLENSSITRIHKKGPNLEFAL